LHCSRSRCCGPRHHPGAIQQAAGNVLVAAGTAWAVWSLRSLGRNVSVIAQARELADRGPYRWVRHPLYAGEIVSSLGLALLAGSVAAWGVWLGFGALQGYRALREEQLLVRVLPGYRRYQARTAALFPGLFLLAAVPAGPSSKVVRCCLTVSATYLDVCGPGR
jgi:protein-S-isoprenylcysteine O-methyltransferase Ste14